MKANSTSWSKGQSGNPAGRPPKGYSITEAVREAMNSKPEMKARLVESIINRAIKGDMTACRLVWEYMDGKPPVSIAYEPKQELVITGLDEIDWLKQSLSDSVKYGRPRHQLTRGKAQNKPLTASSYQR